MARPVQFNYSGENNLKLVKQSPEGFEGEGFLQPNLVMLLVSQEKFNMAASFRNIMLRNRIYGYDGEHIMILPVSDRSAWDFLPRSVIF